MPRRISTATDWRPLDIFQAGREISEGLPEHQIMAQLASSLPNWSHLDDDGRIAASHVVRDSFIFLVKAREDRKGHPRIATVKANLRQIEEGLIETLAALKAMDLRTATLLKASAGERRLTEADYNESPLNESPLPGDAFDRGHHRIELLKRALEQARTWSGVARARVPKQDVRLPDEGLQYFA